LFFFSSRRRHTSSYGDWSSDVCSSDLPGNLIVGEESFARWQGIKLVSKSRDDYPALAQATIAGHPPSSSAGGERPKFGALIGNRSEERRVGKGCIRGM